MTLLKSLLASYKYLIIALEKISIKKLTMKYVTTRLMHDISKHKEKKLQDKDTVMMLRQSRADDPPSR